jgi:hypothetical protein
MTRPHLLDALRDRVLLCDGGMGSRVQALTLHVEEDYWGRENCTDVLVLSRPELVREIHRGYFEAGADMVETNTSLWASSTCPNARSKSTGKPANWRGKPRKASPTGGIAGSSAASDPERNCQASATSPTTRWKPRWPSNAAA